MRILLRSIAPVGLMLLIAGYLGGPGRAAAEPEATSLPTDHLVDSDSADEPVGWRLESTIGLPGDLDPASPPEKRGDRASSSGWTVDVAAPVPAPQVAVTAPPPTPVPAAPAKTAVQKYEVEDNHYVRSFIDQFQSGYRRAVVQTWLARSGRYLPMILDVFRQKGLPDELVFTAMIESGFNPVAVSRAGAKGLWQFMAPTARRYGLRVDDWLDERLDPEKSTMAAARHLLDLYAVFGSWNLVQAAYNAGEMKVLQAVRAMGTSDFWTLRSGPVLREETKNFIPAIQAAAVIAREPERYGFVVTPAEPLQYEIAMVPRGTSLKVLSARSGVPLEAIERLNLELRLKQTPPDAAYPLKVPVDGAQRIQAALAESHGPMAEHAPSRPAELRHGKALPKVHVVRLHESVASIAKRYGVSPADLARWNDLGESARVRPGDRLRIVALSRRE